MSKEALERLKLRRHGNRGVATKYAQKVKQILEDDAIDSNQQWCLITVQKALQEKLKLLLELDDNILSPCPTTEIKREIEEFENANARI